MKKRSRRRMRSCGRDFRILSTSVRTLLRGKRRLGGTRFSLSQSGNLMECAPLDMENPPIQALIIVIVKATRLVLSEIVLPKRRGRRQLVQLMLNRDQIVVVPARMTYIVRHSLVPCRKWEQARTDSAPNLRYLPTAMIALTRALVLLLTVIPLDLGKEEHQSESHLLLESLQDRKISKPPC